MIKEKLKLAKKEEVAANVYKFTLEGSHIPPRCSPGRFLHVQAGDGRAMLLRRPISISAADDQTCVIIFRASGAGTEAIASVRVGDTIDVFGPLGSGFPLLDDGTALLVGGGVGVPPLHFLAEELVKNGIRVKSVIGFRSAEDVFLADELRQYGEVEVTTEDGTYGTKGYVTDAALMNSEFDTFYACGPKAMLHPLQENIEAPGYVSLEERMGCGIGACFACVCDKKDGGYVKICSDGPVFEKGVVQL
ncbi:dihydroorotate dehydrogenase electron transfer subunit [Alkalicoccus luteus]|uniref:Dihydroorotate dehydrogenase B (NAD(+)), electron transfer subunit n=1 Tax=Alkalicoccus luteus TaxID=1237094 RepID=A0A969PRX2_9BACI|nr:dihydroorotate dehydrogenase electron transfer subunit [Alkalicoccus luteus]NJP36424.1 dihydroorotate dehydrogenase electron transfer subunit [Alkalicoccus luteus]